MPKKYTLEKYWETHTQKMESGCVDWTGTISIWGYGVFTFGARRTSAHRKSWEMHRGNIPSGLFVLHKCNNRACVNPDHLKIGTHKENMEDRSDASRYPLGTTHHNSRLSIEQVIEIYKSEGSENSIAKRFKASRCAVNRIRTGAGWRHVTGGIPSPSHWGKTGMKLGSPVIGISPDGREFRFDNLHKMCRELFDNHESARAVFDRLGHYKGWRFRKTP